MHQNKEITATLLYTMYENGLDNLEKGNVAMGREILENILKELKSHSQLEQLEYGCCSSLAEILSHSESIEDKCYALYYYHRQQQLFPSWQATREMAQLFRSIGMIPKALSMIQQTIQGCIPSMHGLLYFQACQLCVLMQDAKQFNFFYANIKEQVILSKAVQMKEYFENKFITPFIEELLQEESEIHQKLKQLPQLQADFTITNPKAVIELKVEEWEAVALLSKIRRSIYNDSDINAFNSEINISWHPMTMICKGKTLKDMAQLKKQSERQKIKVQKQQEECFQLDRYLKESRNPVILKFQMTLDTQEFKRTKQTTLKEEKKETKWMAYNLQDMIKKSYFTIVPLMEDLLPILLIQSEEVLDFQSKLVSVLSLYQNHINVITTNTTIQVKILEIAYRLFTIKTGIKKIKTPKRQIKIQNLISLINKLLIELITTDDRPKNMFNILGEIYIDHNFFVARMAKICADKIEDSELKQKILTQIELNKTYRKELTIQVNAILDQLEQKERIEFNESTQFKFQQLMQADITPQAVQRILQICIQQLHLSTSLNNLREYQETLKKFTEPQTYLNKISADQSLGIIALKYGLILSLIEDSDMHSYIGYFLNSCSKEKRVMCLLITIEIPHLNMHNLFSITGHEILGEMLDLRQLLSETYERIHASLQQALSLDAKIYLTALVCEYIRLNKQFNSHGFFMIEYDPEAKIEPQSLYTTDQEQDFPGIIFVDTEWVDITLDQALENTHNFFGEVLNLSLKPTKLVINMKHPIIQEYLRIFVKETVRNQYGITTKDLRKGANSIIKHYLSKREAFEQVDLMFISRFLLNDKRSQQVMNHIFMNNLYAFIKLIEQSEEIQTTSQQLFNKIMGQNIEVKLEPSEHPFLGNIYYILSVTNDRESHISDQTELSLQLLCTAIAYHNNSQYWFEMYNQLYKLAYTQLTQQKNSSTFDWFIGQKRCFNMMRTQQSDIWIRLSEKQFIMDLLKYRQRRQYSRQSSLAVLQQLQAKVQLVPDDVLNCKMELRKMILWEKIIGRSSMTHENFQFHISRLRHLRALVLQADQGEFSIFFEGKDYEQELELDMCISLYKFIKTHRTLPQGEIPEKPVNIIFNYPVECGPALNHVFYEFEKYQQRLSNKGKSPRYIIEATYYYYHMLMNSERQMETKKYPLLIIHNDLVPYYKIFDKTYIEKDKIMSEYFNHDLIFFRLRSKCIKLGIKIFALHERFKELYQIVDKVQKVYPQRLKQIFDIFTQNKDQLTDLGDLLLKLDQINKRLTEKLDLNPFLVRYANLPDQPDSIQLIRGQEAFEAYKSTKKKRNIEKVPDIQIN